MRVRPGNPDTDIAGIARLMALCAPEENISEERVRSWFQPGPNDSVSLRLVAEQPDGTLSGYACVIHSESMPAGFFYSWLCAHPAFRCQGIGSALWSACQKLLHENQATQVMSEVQDNNSVGLAFAEKRGFRIDHHTFGSRLDLTSFDEEPFLPIIAGLEAQGIHFCTLADLPDTPENAQKYYELNLATVRDIPGEIWNFDAYPLFFQQHIIGAKWFRREGQILALDGDTFAGFASVSLKPERQAAYNATTGVIRAYRGRKIALALKVLAARYARQNGAQWIGTDNDSLNASMLAVNRRMGYQPEDGHYYLIASLENQTPG